MSAIAAVLGEGPFDSAVQALLDGSEARGADGRAHRSTPDATLAVSWAAWEASSGTAPLADEDGLTVIADATLYYLAE